MKNKTRIKDAKRKNRTKTQKFKGGGFFGSLGSFFKSNVSPALTEFLKLKIISDDIQKVYDANNKDEATFVEKMSALNANVTKLTTLMAAVEREKKSTPQTNAKIQNAPKMQNGQTNSTKMPVKPLPQGQVIPSQG
jgi:hypothetical protein